MRPKTMVSAKALPPRRVGSVDAAGDLARGEEAGDDLALGIDHLGPWC
jgi:hypothetical protein